MIQPLVAHNLGKIYREGRTDVRAVSDVSLSLGEGEVVGLLGPSGSGKTTLLSMLGCILRPTGGSLLLFGHEMTTLSEDELPAFRRKYISFIFQGFNLFPSLTALENVMLVFEMKHGKSRDCGRKAQEVLDEVGLSHRVNFLPRELSGGQKQRVAIARALVAGSPLIFADEPTGNLDHVNGRNVMEILQDLAKRKKTTVLVATHDNRVEDLFDRIVRMEDGQVVSEDRRLP